MISSLKLNKVILRSHRSFSSAAACPHLSSENVKKSTESVKPFEKIPIASKYSLIRGFLPGGEFYDKNLDDFYRLVNKKYGNVFMFKGMFGRRDVVMTFNPADFETIFRNEGVWPFRDGLDTLAYHRKVRRTDVFGNISGLVTEQHELWSRLRSTVNPVMMNPKAVKDYIQPIDNVAKEFIEVIRSKRDTQTFEMDKDFKTDLNNWALESIAFIALDTRLQCFDEKNKSPDADILINGMHKFFELSYELDIMLSPWRYFSTPKFNKLMETLDDVTDASIKYIDAAREKMKTQPPKAPAEMSILEKLIKIDRKTAVVMAMDMLFAGIDTTSTALTGILLCLAKNQDKQELLRQEVSQIKNKSLTANDMNNLPYLRACIKEGIRMYPVVSANARNISQDIVVGGYEIPKGVTVAMPMHVLMHDDRYFKDAKKYVPERWIKGNELYKGNSDPFIYLPFGFGPRSCIGKRMSNMELEVIIINLIKNFKIEFNYPTDKAFKSNTVNVPNIPLQFKFTDL